MSFTQALKPLKVALFGHGNMGKYLARNIHAHRGMEIAAICDQNPEKASEVASEPYSSAYFTINNHDALNDDEIDLVVISTLPETHYKLALEALNAGKHVLIEKPITQNADEARHLVSLANEKGLTIMVDHTLLYEEAMPLLLDKSYGEAAKFDFKRAQHLSEAFAKTDRSCFAELAPHVFSVLDAFDKYQSETIQVRWISGDLKHSAEIYVKTETGIEGNIEFTFSPDIDPADEVRDTMIRSKPVPAGPANETTHTAMWNELRNAAGHQEIIITNQNDRQVRSIETGKNQPLIAVADDLFQAITKKRSPISNGDKSIRVMEMMDAAELSKKHGGKDISATLQTITIERKEAVHAV